MICPTCQGTGKPTVTPSGLTLTCACGKCVDCHGAKYVDKEKLKREQDALNKFMNEILNFQAHGEYLLVSPIERNKAGGFITESPNNGYCIGIIKSRGNNVGQELAIGTKILYRQYEASVTDPETLEMFDVVLAKDVVAVKR